MIAGTDQPGMATASRGKSYNDWRVPGRRVFWGCATLRLARHLPLGALGAGTAGHAMDWDDTQLAEGPGRPYGLLMHPTVPPLTAALVLADLVGRWKTARQLPA